MPQRDHSLASGGLDADEIELGSVERLSRARVRKESIAAQSELRNMAFDRLTFPLLLAFGELDLTRRARRGCGSVNNVRCDHRVRRGRMRVVGDGAMIRVQIEARWTDDQRRLKLLNDRTQFVSQTRISAASQFRNALIGKREKRRRPFADTQPCE